MRARLPCHLLLALAATATCRAQAPAATSTGLPRLVQRYCAECHTGDDAEQDFVVDALFAETADPERIATAVQRLRSRTMPPPDADSQPTTAERFRLTAMFDARLPTDPEARLATVRRLSRAEYENTIRELCGIVWDGRDLLPEDARASGFDNQGAVMSITPLLFEKYLEAAATITTAVLADPAAHHRVFGTDQPLATALPLFLARAFRRPVAPEELAERLALFDTLVQQGNTPAVAQAAVLRSILASPAFLYRAERGPAAAPDQLTAHELAVRLSYLLTASMPDERLFDLAQNGTLAEPAVLTAEARRLVEITAGRPLADNFAAQWLRFRDVLTANADFRRYPQIWNGGLRPSFYQEAATFFAALVRDDGSILNLLDADFTYANEALAKHYGLPAVVGEQFQKVQLPDRRRGGVLGMGAMLMVSSFPLRTSPVLRGKWILELLLDAPTPPPPANAGVLPPDDEQPDHLTLRARLEHHRRDRACASCHAQMDPLGFALENYDVLGQWRTESHGLPVDTRAQLPDGTQLDGPLALKDALLARKADFVRTMAKKLLVYGIGRPMLPADEAEVSAIVLQTEAGDYHFQALLAAIVTSPLFTHRDPGGAR